ncbi:MAG: hypothetical protein ABI543_07810 [Ignavibacteria bacterium]
MKKSFFVLTILLITTVCFSQNKIINRTLTHGATAEVKDSLKDLSPTDAVDKRQFYKILSLISKKNLIKIKKLRFNIILYLTLNIKRFCYLFVTRSKINSIFTVI